MPFLYACLESEKILLGVSTMHFLNEGLNFGVLVFNEKLGDFSAFSAVGSPPPFSQPLHEIFGFYRKFGCFFSLPLLIIMYSAWDHNHILHISLNKVVMPPLPIQEGTASPKTNKTRNFIFQCQIRYIVTFWKICTFHIFEDPAQNNLPPLFQKSQKYRPIPTKCRKLFFCHTTSISRES